MKLYEGGVIATGKSGYLLELWGLIEADSYDTSFTLSSNKSPSRLFIQGCESITKDTPEEQGDFLKQLICLDTWYFASLSQTYTMKKIPSNFEKVKSASSKNSFICSGVASVTKSTSSKCLVNKKSLTEPPTKNKEKPLFTKRLSKFLTIEIISILLI